eukprot:UN09667
MQEDLTNKFLVDFGLLRRNDEDVITMDEWLEALNKIELDEKWSAQKLFDPYMQRKTEQLVATIDLEDTYNLIRRFNDNKSQEEVTVMT